MQIEEEMLNMSYFTVILMDLKTPGSASRSASDPELLVLRDDQVQSAGPTRLQRRISPLTSCILNFWLAGWKTSRRTAAGHTASEGRPSERHAGEGKRQMAGDQPGSRRCPVPSGGRRGGGRQDSSGEDPVLREPGGRERPAAV